MFEAYFIVFMFSVLFLFLSLFLFGFLAVGIAVQILFVGFLGVLAYGLFLY